MGFSPLKASAPSASDPFSKVFPCRHDTRLRATTWLLETVDCTSRCSDARKISDRRKKSTDCP
jgi:hypothetical protein